MDAPGACASSMEKREPHKRIFTNRSLSLEKIKFYGFDMDYTLAEYISPNYEKLGFNMIRDHMLKLGYPSELAKLEFKAEFPIRGLWWDNLHGNLLKVDGFGNILFCVHGLRFLKPEEISVTYPNKFIQLEEKRIYVYNTLFNLPEIYLIAAIIDYFAKHPEYKETKEGFKWKDLLMSYESIFQDVRNAVDYVHMRGELKEKTCENLQLYIHKDERLPKVLYNLRASGAKTFLLTNSDWNYTNKVMEYLLNFPDAPYAGESWQRYFDYTFVDARKPEFFSEGTVMRQVDKNTGQLSLGHHTGSIKEDAVYSGGSCDVLSRLIGARGRDVLYVGDHIFGDVLKSKKLRGWRTFLIVPELNDELNVWTTKKDLFDKLQSYDHELSELYKNMDSSNQDRPNVVKIKKSIRETIHTMEMTYGTTGSVFRSGSRQTFFSSQVVRYADLYAGTMLNLLFYPTFYMFRAPSMLLPHESTVAHHDQTLQAVTARTSRSVFNRGLSMDDMLTKGEEPTQCHEIDDDEDCDEVSSEKSNESH
ncbi:cytosolic purine 5'-nucleotidase [Eurytemora carolleeae]|uniref:cytosolic purine 5'-nucleotidase n=1 Tax=Eurytemora carolleeae TaxID=1294199 RepID=UPI000C78D878|nr:cytosolic purine 5'-nucleotidase [Eurytemora carolleeae]|eukprot:XP_023338424.1 cytosolic purine 5'-nucleotidase-like [Eurytemora affinis]